MNFVIYLDFEPKTSFLFNLGKALKIRNIIGLKFKKKSFKLKVVNYFLIFFNIFKKNDDIIKLYLRSECKINSNYLTEIKNYLKSVNSQKTIIMYSDSLFESSETVSYIARPEWSPILFEKQDYLGEVISIIPNANFRKVLFDELINLELNELVKENKIEIIRIPEGIYKINSKNYKIKSKNSLDSKNVNFNQNTTKSKKYLSAKKISIVIPTTFQKNHSGVSVVNLIQSFEKFFNGFKCEIILGYHEINEKKYEESKINNLFKDKFQMQSYKYNYDFNFSKVVNSCVNFSKYKNILLLNDDIFFKKKFNLECLFNHLDEDGVGVIGIKLLYPNKLIQHDGIYFENKQPQNFLQGSELKFMPHAQNYCREITAVTGAFMLFTKKVFESNKGFNENFPNNYNDVDFCLRLHKNGLKSVICNSSYVYHIESLSRKNIKMHDILLDLEKLNLSHEINFRDNYLYTPNF